MKKIDKDQVHHIAGKIGDLDQIEKVCINWIKYTGPEYDMHFRFEEISVYPDKDVNSKITSKVRDMVKNSELSEEISVSESTQEFITGDEREALILFKSP